MTDEVRCKFCGAIVGRESTYGTVDGLFHSDFRYCATYLKIRVAELKAELNECDEWRQRWARLWLWSFAPPDEPLEKGWYDVYYWERQEFGEAFYENGVFSADGERVFPTHYAHQRSAPGIPPPQKDDDR